jgi:uncharacterized protein
MNQRIIGIDLARCFCIFGMMVVNYHFAFGALTGNKLLLETANFFNGRASATFVVLAGVGIILFSRKARMIGAEQGLLHKTRMILIKRAILLFLLGTIDSILWPADILRSYGAFFFFASFILTKPKSYYLNITFFMIIVFTFFYFAFDFKADWNLERYQYNDFWTIGGFLKSLFFNGWNPIFPWFGIFTYGMYLGASIFEEGKQMDKLVKMILLPFLILFGISLLPEVTNTIHPNLMQHRLVFDSIFTINQLPPLPLYYFLSIGFATILLFLFLKIGEAFQNYRFFEWMATVGRNSHTIYLTHIYFGIIAYLFIRKLYTEDEYYSAYGTESIEFMWIFLLISFILHAIAIHTWLKFFKHGPMEALVQKLSK